jgi:hypothetical protein
LIATKNSIVFLRNSGKLFVGGLLGRDPIDKYNPKILDTYQMNPDNPYVAPQRVQGNAQLDLNEEEEPAQHQGRIIAMPYGNSRSKGSQYGDLKIVTSFPGDIQKAILTSQ